MARRQTPGAATHRHKDTLAGRQEGCTRAKVTAPRPGLSTIPTVPSDRWTKGLRHSDSLFSRCHEHVVLQHPLIWQDCPLPSCRIHTPWQWPALRELPSEVLPSKEQSQGWGRRGSLSQRKDSSPGPRSLPASCVSPSTLSSCSILPGVFPVMTRPLLLLIATRVPGCHPPCFSLKLVNSGAGGPGAAGGLPAPPHAAQPAAVTAGDAPWLVIKRSQPWLPEVQTETRNKNAPSSPCGSPEEPLFPGPARPPRLGSPCPPAQHVWAAGGPPRPRETSARARPPPRNARRPGGFRVAHTADRCSASGQFLGGPPGWAQGAERVEVWRWPAGALPTPGTRRGARCRRPRACRHGGGHREHGINHTCHIPRRAQRARPP